MGAIKNVLIFVAGVSVGAVAAGYATKSKYDKLLNERFKAFENEYKSMSDDKSDEEESDPEPETEQPAERKEYEELATNYASSGRYPWGSDDKNIKKGGDEMVDKKYVVEPEEFDTIPEYDTVSFTYYADGVVTDEWDQIISDADVEQLIGKESLNHFGEYEDDSVFVRNETRKTDFEILMDNRKYADLFLRSPRGDK